jgi:hypothetical protein
MVRILLISILFSWTSVFGQTKSFSAKDIIISNLSSWLNPKRDSIKNIKLNSIIRLQTFKKQTIIIDETTYDKNGYIIFNKNADGYRKFTYDSVYNLVNVQYSRGADVGKLFEGQISINRDIDTVSLFSILFGYSPILSLKHTQNINYLNKNKDLYYSDTIKIADAKIITFNSATTNGVNSYIRSIILPKDGFSSPNLVEIYEYDIVLNCLLINHIRYDTLNKIKKTYSYFPIYYKNNPEILKNYRLFSIKTEIQRADLKEFITEEYNDGNEKFYNKVKFITIEKISINYSESKTYKLTFIKTKKLVHSLTAKTQFTYY